MIYSIQNITLNNEWRRPQTLLLWPIDLQLSLKGLTAHSQAPEEISFQPLHLLMDPKLTEWCLIVVSFRENGARGYAYL